MTKAMAVLVALFASIALAPVSAQAGPPSQPQEKDFAFPYPVQWRADCYENFECPEISVSGVAWGPANSPEMISRGRGAFFFAEKPFSVAGSPYALAIRLQTTLPSKNPTDAGGSGLLLVRDVRGDYQMPLQLTPEGFVHYTGSPGVSDLRSTKGSRTSEDWEFFPVSPQQREFLFQAFPESIDPIHPGASFQVLIGKSGIKVVNLAIARK